MVPRKVALFGLALVAAIACSGGREPETTGTAKAALAGACGYAPIPATSPGTATFTPGWGMTQFIVPQSFYSYGALVTARLSFGGTSITCDYPCMTDGTCVASTCSDGSAYGSRILATSATLSFISGPPGTFVDASISYTAEDGNLCTSDTCVAENGTVQHSAANDGQVCDTSNACRAASTCSSGTCAPGAVVDPNDGNACTDDTCTSGIGIQNAWNYQRCPAPPNVSANDDTAVTDFSNGVAFLYSGTSPTQTGITTTIDPKRAAVVRGRVVTNNAGSYVPLANVNVTIQGFGQTTTRNDGWFDMVVNGGGDVLVRITPSPPYLPVARHAETRWHDYTVLNDVILTPQDSTNTAVTRASSSWQVHRATTVSEGGISRTSVVLFPPNWDVDPASWSSAPSTLHMRATELTTQGANAMPGELPATSGYTYAVEFGFDEANGKDVRFLTPAIAYSESVLPEIAGTWDGGSWDGGGPVPAGWFDRDAGVWRAEPNGATAKIVGITGGNEVQLDCNGDGVDSGECPTLTGEKQALYTAYCFSSCIGKVLWRVPETHFSSWDWNWGFGPPNPHEEPPDAPPRAQEPVPDNDKICGSIIDCQNQALGWAFPVAGTGHSLRYQSDRQVALRRPVIVPITAPAPSQNNPWAIRALDGPIRVEVEFSVAGKKSTITQGPDGAGICGQCEGGYSCSWCYKGDRTVTYTWDGLDAYGRRVQGPVPMLASVTYVYNGRTAPTASFGGVNAGSGVSMSGNRANREFSFTRRYSLNVGNFDALGLGLGGLTLTPHHVYDPATATLYYGDGRRRMAQSMTGVLTTVAGAGMGSANDGSAAKGADLGQFYSVAAGPDGALYFDDRKSVSRVRRMGADGILGTVYGIASACSSSPSFNDGDVATASCRVPTNIEGNVLAVGADDSVYLTTSPGNGADQVIRLNPGTPRTMTLVAGLRAGGNDGLIHDGAVAANTSVSKPTAVALGRDGSVYFTSMQHHVVYQIATNGIMHVIGGLGGTTCTTLSGLSDGAGAATVPLCNPRALAVAPDGSVIVGVSTGNSDGRVVRIGRDGKVKVLAGGGGTLAADGMVAVQALLRAIYSVSIDGAGRIYFAHYWAQSGSGAIFRIETDGTLRHIAGAGSGPPVGPDGTLAVKAASNFYSSVATGPDGLLYLVDWSQTNGQYSYASGVRRVALGKLQVGQTYLVPSEDGAEVYEFDAKGKHQRTLTGLRGKERLRFNYDATSGLLTSVEDRSNGGQGPWPTMTVARTSTIVEITAPFGMGTKKTIITRDAQTQYATQIANPNNELFGLTLGTNGLLTQLTDPRSYTHRFDYDADGRLTRDRNALPFTGGTTLGFALGTPGAPTNWRAWSVTLTSPEGRGHTYAVDDKPDPAIPYLREKRTLSFPANVLTNARVEQAKLDGSRKLVDFSGTTYDSSWIADSARFDMQSPTLDSVTVTRGADAHLAATSVTKKHSHAVYLSSSGDVFSLSGATAMVDADWYDGDASHKWTRTFDATQSKWTTTSPESRSTATVLDAQDRVSQLQVLGTGGITGTTIAPISIHYDALGRADAVSQTDGTYTRAQTLTFDQSTGLVTSIATPFGAVAYNGRDGAGRVTQMTLPGSRIVNLGYDAAGNLTLVQEPAGQQHLFGSNGNDLLELYAPPQVSPPISPKDTTYSYDRDGLLTLASTPSAAVTYQYDDAGRIATRSTPQGTVSYAYDSATGNLASVNVWSGVGHTYSYANDLLTKDEITGMPGAPHKVEYFYDNRFRLASRRLEGSAQNDVVLGYDNDGLVKTVSLGAVTMTLTVSPNGQLASVRTTGNGGDLTETYEYFPSWGELKQVCGFQTSGGSCNSSLYKMAYTRELTTPVTGRVVIRADTFGGSTTTHTFGYDSSNRIASWQSGGTPTSYTYDANGNRTGQVYDAQDRQTQWSDWEFLWSNNGEWYLDRWPAGGPWYWYQYSAAIDVFGNLRSFHDDMYGSINATYLIDGLDRRVGWYSGGTFQEGYLYDERGRIIAQLDLNGALKAQFVYVTKPNVPDLMKDADGVYRIVSDQVGSVREVIKIASTYDVKERVDYDPWGAPTPVTGWLFQPFTFAGGLFDPATALVRFGARDYDPYRGRWFSKDKLKFASGPNLYVYADNDPINEVDPSGKVPMPLDPVHVRRAIRCLQITPTGDFVGLFSCLRGEPPADFERCAGMGIAAAGACCRAECRAFDLDDDDLPLTLCPVPGPREVADPNQSDPYSSLSYQRKTRCLNACRDLVWP